MSTTPEQLRNQFDMLKGTLVEVTAKLTAVSGIIQRMSASGGTSLTLVAEAANLNRELVTTKQLMADILLQRRQVAGVSGQTMTNAGTIGTSTSTSTEISKDARSSSQDIAAQQSAAKSAEEAAKASLNNFKNMIAKELPASFSKSHTAVLADLTRQYKALGSTMADTTGKVSTSVAKGNLTVKASFKDAQGAVLKLGGEYNRLGVDVKLAMQQAASANKTFARAFDLARKGGFSDADLAKVYKRGDSGVHELQFQRTNTEGIDQVHNINVDKLGNVIPDISRQYKTFTQGIIRNTRELLKWTLAMGLIYAPLNKLNDLFTLMITNETKLAESMIAVNSSIATSEQVFDGVYQAAKKAGEGVSGTLDAFTQAYRASGRLGDSSDRFNKSLILLDDSLMLSKLSTLNQADAIDTLSAALYQTGLELDQGSYLLDKWVHVSKYANVDLAALSTGFSVLGNTAGAAGLGVDQLNGLIAAISTTTGVMSSSGIANVAKALVGNYTTPAAIKQMEIMGISVKNLAGENRDYLSVMREISQMRESDVLSDSAFSKITLALGGGGVRRQKDVAALIENFPLVDEVSGISALADGDAQEALAIQLDTVQTSSTRLSGAFQKLANDLGSDGGALDSMSEVLDITTWLVEKFDLLTKAIGKTGPALYSLALVAAYVGKKQQGTFFDSLLFGARGPSSPGVMSRVGSSAPVTGIANWGRTNIMGGTRVPIEGPLPEGVTKRPSIVQSATGGAATGMTNWGKAATGLAVGMIPAVQNISQGDTEEGIANMFGAGLGSALGGGSLIWAMAGAAIAEAFVRTTMTYDTEFASFFKETYGKEGKPLEEIDDEESRINILKSDAFKTAGLGSELFGKQVALAGTFVEYLKGVRSETGGLIDSEQAAKMILENQNPELLQQFYAEQRTNRLEAGLTATEGYTESSDLTKLQEILLERDSDLLSSIATEKREFLLSDLVSGEIKTAEYTQKTEQLSGYAVKASKYAAAYGSELMDSSDEINTEEDIYRAFLTMFIDGSMEQTSRITSLIDQVEIFKSALETSVPGEKTINIGGVDIDREQVETDIASMYSQMVDTTVSSLQEIALNKVVVPSVVGDMMQPREVDETDKIIDYARELEKATKGASYTPKLYEAYLDTLSPIQVATGETATGLPTFTEYDRVSSSMYSQAEAALVEQGEISSVTGGNFGVQQLDIDSSRAGELAAAMDWSGDLLENMGYTLNPEDQGVIYSDYITDVLHADNLQMRLALDKLVDINQEQLDGMYNIPEGAVFRVPLTAASYGRGGDSGSFVGDTSSIEDKDEDETVVSTSNLIDYNDKTDVLSMRDRFLKDELNEIPDVPVEREFEGISSAAFYTPSRERVASESDNVSIWKELFDPLWQKIIDPLNSFGFEGGNLQPSIAPMSNTEVDTAPAIQLEVSLNSTTQLVMDGRQIANIVKSYLESDLLRAEESMGSVVKQYVW